MLSASWNKTFPSFLFNGKNHADCQIEWLKFIWFKDTSRAKLMQIICIIAGNYDNSFPHLPIHLTPIHLLTNQLFTNQNSLPLDQLILLNQIWLTLSCNLGPLFTLVIFHGQLSRSLIIYGIYFTLIAIK